MELTVERLGDALHTREAILLGAHLERLEGRDHRLACVDRLRRRGLLEPDACTAHTDLVTGLERGTVHEVAVESRAVLAAEVNDEVLLTVALKAAMKARRAQVHHGDLVVDRASDEDALLVDLEDRPLVFLVNDESGHAPTCLGTAEGVARPSCGSILRDRRAGEAACREAGPRTTASEPGSAAEVSSQGDLRRKRALTLAIRVLTLANRARGGRSAGSAKVPPIARALGGARWYRSRSSSPAPGEARVPSQDQRDTMAKSFTTQELADLAGVPVSRIHKWEGEGYLKPIPGKADPDSGPALCL